MVTMARSCRGNTGHLATRIPQSRKTIQLRLGRGLGCSRLEHVGKVALATVLSVLVPCHEDTGTALGCRALSAETLESSVGVDLVVLQDTHLDLLPLVLDLLAVKRERANNSAMGEPTEI